jgi:hypothetical protein
MNQVCTWAEFLRTLTICPQFPVEVAHAGPQVKVFYQSPTMCTWNVVSGSNVERRLKCVLGHNAVYSEEWTNISEENMAYIFRTEK